MRIRLFFISFVAMFQMLLATQSKAQCTGDFRIVASMILMVRSVRKMLLIPKFILFLQTYLVLVRQELHFTTLSVQ